MATSPNHKAIPPEVFGPLIDYMAREGVSRVAIEAVDPGASEVPSTLVSTLERQEDIVEDVAPDAPGLRLTHIVLPVS